jgi:LmbE family N-acetylglucosaminyl deacetylase
MFKRLSLVLLFFILAAGNWLAGPVVWAQAEGIKVIEPITKGDRILILAPHPDDETIGCAGIIQQALSAGAQVRVVYLTNGDHNQIAFIVYEKRLTLRKGEFIHMGEVRRQEAIKAMALLGLDENNLVFLGYPDFGTFTIFSQYWQETKPFKSLLTRISSVPYKENLSFAAPYKGESILSDLEKVLLGYKPNKIFVSHPADTNVDHKALYLFLQVALRDLDKELSRPKIYPYLIHCVGWPLPRRYHPELRLTPPQQFLDAQINWSKFGLTQGQINKKYQAVLCYKSQTESSASYLLSFARSNELFADYADIRLEKQASLKEKAVSFFGFSNMYDDSDIDTLVGLDKLIGTKGQASYAVVDNSILIRIEKAEELNRKFSLMLYLFGYSERTPFAEMPKVRIITKHNKFKVFDGRKKIQVEGVSVELNPSELIFKIPLEILGNPEFILTSMKAYRGILPVDAIAFRKIEIK